MKYKDGLKYDVLFGVIVTAMAMLLDIYMFKVMQPLTTWSIARNFLTGSIASYVGRYAARQLRIRVS